MIGFSPRERVSEWGERKREMIMFNWNKRVNIYYDQWVLFDIKEKINGLRQTTDRF